MKIVDMIMDGASVTANKTLVLNMLHVVTYNINLYLQENETDMHYHLSYNIIISHLSLVS